MTHIKKKQNERSLLASTYVVVRPNEHGGIIVRMRAFGVFTPGAFHLLRCELQTGTATIAGRLEEITSEHARGTRFDYRFVPDDPAHAGQIEFQGRNHWSNVQHCTVQTARGPIRARNEFDVRRRPTLT